MDRDTAKKQLTEIRDRVERNESVSYHDVVKVLDVLIDSATESPVVQPPPSVSGGGAGGAGGADLTGNVDLAGGAGVTVGGSGSSN